MLFAGEAKGNRVSASPVSAMDLNRCFIFNRFNGYEQRGSGDTAAFKIWKIAEESAIYDKNEEKSR
jgi:hypothetical protein